MKKLTLILVIIFLSCTSEENYKSVELEIGGELYTVKVPKGEVYKEAYYDEFQASKTIHLNLNNSLQEKLSLENVEKLIGFQGDYIRNQQKRKTNFSTMDEPNIRYLQLQANAKGINLSKEELIEVFEVELFYMKLIKIIE